MYLHIYTYIYTYVHMYIYIQGWLSLSLSLALSLSHSLFLTRAPTHTHNHTNTQGLAAPFCPCPLPLALSPPPLLPSALSLTLTYIRWGMGRTFVALGCIYQPPYTPPPSISHIRDLSYTDKLRDGSYVFGPRWHLRPDRMRHWKVRKGAIETNPICQQKSLTCLHASA